MKFTVKGISPEQLAHRIFYTAWQACGRPMGMGILQDRGDKVPEEAVVNNVKTAGDYPGMPRSREAGELYGDYVFGRMLKTTVKFGADFVEVRPDNPRPDYQGWMCRFNTPADLVKAAAATFPGAEVVEVK